MNTLPAFFSHFLAVLLSASTFILGSAPLYAADEEGLVMGVFPRRSATETFTLFGPLTQYLEHQLGQPVRLETAKDFQTFWQGVENDYYDLIHYNQYHYLIARKNKGHQVILKNVELGEATIAGAIMVRKDSGIRSVADLKGRKIVFGGDTKAMQSYIVARYLLQENGLNHGEYQENFAKSPPSAILAAYFKQADAAGVGDKVLYLDTVKNQINVEEMELLVVSEQMAHLPWAVKADMDDARRDKIQTLLAGLKDSERGRALLAGAKLTALDIAEDREYNPHRALVKAVFDEEY
jgi:phosphonate transport system substrate-binding protein